MVAIDSNVLFLALPGITVDLGASGFDQLWVADIYTLFVGSLVIVAGAIGDRIGRRRLLRWGCTGFLVASLIAAAAPSPGWLITARALQGVAGATLMPSTLALIGQLFADDHQRTKAISLWGTCAFGCSALGPVVGGVMLGHLWWGSVFLISIPPCLTVLLLGGRLLPEDVPAASAPQIDPPSVLLLVGAIAPLLLACKTMLPSVDAPAWAATALLAAGLLLGTLFVRRQLTIEEPLLDIALLARAAIAATVVALVLSGICLAGLALWATQYLQSGLGLSPLAAAAAFTPMGLSMAASTMLAPRAARWVPPTTAVPLGLALSAVGGLLLTAASSALGIMTTLSIVAIGCGPLFAFGIARVIAAAPIDRAGRAAGLSETCNYLGSTLGVALLGSVGGWLYTHSLHGALSGLPEQQTDDAVQGLPAGRSLALSLSQPGLQRSVTHAGADALHGLGILVCLLFLIAAAATAWAHPRTKLGSHARDRHCQGSGPHPAVG